MTFSSPMYRILRGYDERLQEDAAVELIRALHEEVPELQEGAVSVVRAVRAPGLGGKVSVRAASRRHNPAAVVIGPSGYHIRRVAARLGQERLQVVPFLNDRIQYVRAALRPAFAGLIREEEGVYVVAPLPDDAGKVIGRKGINVALASALVEARLHVVAAVSLAGAVGAGEL